MASPVCARPRARRRQAAEEHSIAYMVALTFLVLLVVPTWAMAAQRPFCLAKPSHTLCRNPNPACLHKKKGLDAAARAQILKLHNGYRSQVALGQLPGFGPAADMQELIWDDELAEVAQAHAELCTDTSGNGRLQHDESRDRTTATFPAVGQNLASSVATYVSPTDWGDVVKGWFDDYPLNQSDRIQVIWAKTRYVGCGFLQYYVQGSQWTDVKLYTCNYGPGGNYSGEPVYQAGATCSACPASTVCNQTTGLCGASAPPPPATGGAGSGDGEASGDHVVTFVTTSYPLPWLLLLLWMILGVLVGLGVGTAALFLWRRYVAREDVAAPQATADATKAG